MRRSTRRAATKASYKDYEDDDSLTANETVSSEDEESLANKKKVAKKPTKKKPSKKKRSDSSIKLHRVFSGPTQMNRSGFCEPSRAEKESANEDATSLKAVSSRRIKKRAASFATRTSLTRGVLKSCQFTVL